MSEVSDWLARFAEALNKPENADWGALFAEDGYWRDLVAVSWNIVTVEGPEGVKALATAQAKAIAAHGFAEDGPEGWFTFETATARCRGHVQLEAGRAKSLLTAMVELIGHEEIGGARRPQGLDHRAARGRKTWADERAEREASFGVTEQPYCLIVGGGQNGIQLAARLKRLGVPTLVVDALEKPGDCWRVRYPSLYLHDPIFLDHFPYLPFPDHWPLYTHKDKMADWIELYAKAMEIDFRGNTRCIAAQYNAAKDQWEVTLEREGELFYVHPKQLVLATGLSGAKSIPAIPGAERFKGATYHSSEHKGRAGVEGKHCVVIGSNNSAHDIAVDLWEGGAEVTMIQRSPTIVVRAETMRELAKTLPYADPASDTDFVDLAGAIASYRSRLPSEQHFAEYLNEVDGTFYARLAERGFELWQGEDASGFFMAYYRRAAGYYIDVGGSDLIADGSIALAHGEIAEIAEDGVKMADGAFLPADILVYGTGYRPMEEWVGKLISPEVQAKIGRVWGLGSGTEGDPGPWEGELRNMWKPTAQEGLWFQGGNLMQARFHSLHLALQLKARFEGLETPVYRPTSSLRA